MSLVVIVRNISNLADVSDYDVEVSINQKQYIYTGIVRGHKRSDGAAELLRKIASDMETNRRDSESGNKK